MAVYLVCPLCGKLAHLSRFNPDKYSDDIRCVEMRSLGRAKGFEVTRRFSALGDEELMDLISRRCHAILTIIGEEDTESEDQLMDEILELQESVDEYEEEMDGLLAQVNDALSEVYEAFSDLESAVGSLIIEYHEAVEEAEDGS